MINDGLSLIDYYIDGQIDAFYNNEWNNELKIENCIVKSFNGPGSQFKKLVKFVNCHFDECNFIGTFFLGGLLIENCTFSSYLDFQSGGHNKPLSSIIIKDNTFNDFVNFFDCWYESDVIVQNNCFNKGTNLLGKPNGISVSFDVVPLIENNTGKLDYDNEG